MNYKKLIREVPNFPKPGILFYDITTLLKDRVAFRSVIGDLTVLYRNRNVAKVVGIESRGFILGAPLAHQLSAGFVPVRKSGKLPADIFEVKYNLEYGSNSLAVHRDAITMSERSEEHTSELQSQSNLVCRLLLEKKKKTQEQQQV